MAEMGIEFHRTLNPMLFDGDNLKSEVREKLLAIAKDFEEHLGINLKGLRDITISGSNAGYNYTPDSDIDLHLIVDIPKADDDRYFRSLFDAKKYQYNAENDFKIKGYDVELYIQPSTEEHYSTGIYSLKDNTWVKKPEASHDGYDPETTKIKYNHLKNLIKKAIKSNDKDFADKLRRNIKKYRKSGLASHGEFGPENLAFKMLRRNGWIEKLFTHLGELKNREFSLKEASLNEIAMSPSALQQFASLPVAKNMSMGFEAEMCIENNTPLIDDMSYDGEISETSFSDLEGELSAFFFNTDYRKIKKDVEEVKRELIKANEDRFLSDLSLLDIEDIIRDIDPDLSDEEIFDSIKQKDDNYDLALDILRDDYYNSDVAVLEKFLRDQGIELYSLWASRYGYEWPHKEDDVALDAAKLAKEFSEETGFSAVGSREYHQVSRAPNLWIFEPDSSIEAPKGYGGIELVSPPMPLEEGMAALEKFFAWSETVGAKTNTSTGFHVGVSVPRQNMENIDHLKLILMMGDKHVLETFGRSTNNYTNSMLDKVYDKVKKLDINASDTLGILLSGLEKKAFNFSRKLMLPSDGDRYVSINIKSNYIEFRSPGGDYLEKKEEIKNTIYRFIRAMASAANPEMDKNEFAKKLYKMLSSYSDNTDAIALFSRYSANLINKSQLKSQLLAKKQKKPALPESQLNELGESSFPYELLSSETIGNTRQTKYGIDRGELGKIVVAITQYRNKIEIYFYETDDEGNTEFRLTGKGQAYKIFGTVRKILTEYLKKNYVTVIEFTGDISEPSRLKFYSNLASKFSVYFPDFERNYYDDEQDNEDEIAYRFERVKNRKIDELKSIDPELRSILQKEKLQGKEKRSKGIFKLDDFAKFLKSKGWNRIGSGSYGMVFSSPENRNFVIKVFADDGEYIKYIKEIKAGVYGDNPHLPKTYGVPRTLGTFGYIRIEKLKPASREQINLMYSIMDAIHRNSQELTNLSKRYPQLVELITILTNEKGDDLDLHGGNIMQRDDGTVVVVDPVAPFTSDVNENRFANLMPAAPVGSDRLSGIEQKLASIGWNRVGLGAYGIVFKNPKYPYVIKVFSDDPNYYTWFEFMRANQDNPHIPKIIGYRAILDDRALAIRLEKLYSIDIDQFKAVNEIDKRIQYSKGTSREAEVLEFLENKYPEYSKLIALIKLLHEKTPWLDLHADNVMQRSDGTIVITDPVTSMHTLDPLNESIDEARFAHLIPTGHGSDRFDSVTNKLENLGWRKLGQGLFGVTYQNPKYPYIIKVFSDDPGYKKWFDFVRKNQNNPHVPKIRGYKMILDDRAMAIRIEKLKPISKEKFRLVDDINNALSMPSLLNYSRDYYNALKIRKLENLYNKYPDHHALIDLFNRINTGIAFVDLHDQNVMERDDGTIVITDPFADDPGSNFGKVNETLKKVKGRWALVSKSDPKKVLQYYKGSGKPSDEWVSKVERRVHSFKESHDDIFTDFVNFVCDRLSIDTAPQIVVKSIDKSFGAYNPERNELYIDIKNRHPMDVFRTIAHELVHVKQKETGKLDNMAQASETGSKEENEANAIAGEIMRDVAEENPEYFELKKVETVMFEGYEIPKSLLKSFTHGQISAMLGGHVVEDLG